MGTRKRHLDLTTPSDLQCLARVRTLIREFAREAGFPEERIFDLTLAVSELVANAIEHAPSDAEVTVTGKVDDERLEVVVTGEGAFLPPQRSSDGHRGLGLPLVVSLIDQVQFRRTLNGMQVRLCLERKG